MIEFFYTLTNAFPVVCGAIGIGIGQGLTGKKALEAINTQPSATQEISKMMLIGAALIETAAVLATVIAFMLLFDTQTSGNAQADAVAKIGISLAIGISSLVCGIVASFPAQAACASLARQPFMNAKILNLMLITQTLIMTPNIFGFLIALLIKNQLHTLVTFEQGLQMLAAGISIGIGCVGPAIGLSLFARAACTAVGINKKAYSKIVSFTFLSEAIIETSLIFALLVSLSILSLTDPITPIKAIALCSAACCMGISTLGTGISAGRTASSACMQIAYHPEQYSSLSKISMLALAMIDTFAIYGLLIALVLIFTT